MKKFTSIRPENQVTKKKDNVLYSNNNFGVIEYDEWSVMTGKDGVICIPYLIELNQFIIRQEYIPSYKYRDGQDYHLAFVGGGIEEGETPEEALLRELQEEAGIVIRDNFKIEFEKPLFVNKNSSVLIHPCIIPLTENDYHEVVIKGDGSRVEKMAQTAKLDVKYLNSLNPSDVVTELMLIKFKEYLNMK